MGMKLIIAGTGRHGSATMFRLFNNLGVPCGHEEVFTVWDGFRSWEAHSETKFHHPDFNFPTAGAEEYMADSSFCATPYLHQLDPDNTIVYHILRDPVTSWISQMSSHFDSPIGMKMEAEHTGFWNRPMDDPEVHPWLRFMTQHTHTVTSESDPFQRSLKYLHEWTHRTDKQLHRFVHHFRDQLENITVSKVEKILELLGVDPAVNVQDAVENIGVWNERPTFYSESDLPTDSVLFRDLQWFYNKADQ